MTALSLISEAPAVFSPDRKYRYVLRRRVGFGDRSVLVVMLNPSIADEERDDATVKRVIGFAVAYGFSWLTVCNAFGFCSTEPENLYRVDDPVGPDNDSTIVREATRAERVIVGWGNEGVFQDRDKAVMKLLRDAGKPAYCWKITNTGQPSHPLYLPKTTELMIYTGRE